MGVSLTWVGGRTLGHHAVDVAWVVVCLAPADHEAGLACRRYFRSDIDATGLLVELIRKRTTGSNNGREEIFRYRAAAGAVRRGESRDNQHPSKKGDGEEGGHCLS